MKTTRSILVVLLAFVWTPAFAGTNSKWMTGYTVSGASNSASRFGPPIGGAVVSGTEDNMLCIAPTAGTVSKLYAKFSAAPGAGKSWEMMFRKEKGTTALTCTVTDTGAGETACSDTNAGHAVSVVAGDRLSMRISPTGTPAAANVTWSLEFVSSVTGETVLCGASGVSNLATAGTQYGPLAGSNAGNENTSYIVMPTTGTLKSFYVRLNTAPGVGTSRTFTVHKSSGNTTLTVTYTDAENLGKSDTNGAHEVSVSAGDILSVESGLTGTPAASVASWGIVFVPTTNGDFVIPEMSTSGSLDTTNNRYMGIGSVHTAYNGTEGAAATYSTGDFAIKNMYVKLTADPANGGGTQKYDINLRENSANTSPVLALAISEGSTAGNATATVTPAAGSLLGIEFNPDQSPAVGRAAVSFLGHIDPPSTCKGAISMLGVGGC